jgi:hypothetical protein
MQKNKTNDKKDTRKFLNQKKPKKIQIFARLKPNLNENNKKKLTCQHSDNILRNQTAQCEFQNIFDDHCTNGNVYHGAIEKSIATAFEQHCDCIVMCYGPTNSGKTHTMFGSKNEIGIIHLCISDIFNNIRSELITCNCIEFYNGKKFDLVSLVLTPTSNVFNLVNDIQKRSHKAHTSNNTNSNRGHTIVELITEHSTICLIDLAGLEPGSSDQQQREGTFIRKDLYALKRIMNGISTMTTYRESNFVKYLYPALTGKDTIISLLCTLDLINNDGTVIRTVIDLVNEMKDIKHAVSSMGQSKKNDEHRTTHTVSSLGQSRNNDKHRIIELEKELGLYKKMLQLAQSEKYQRDEIIEKRGENIEDVQMHTPVRKSTKIRKRKDHSITVTPQVKKREKHSVSPIGSFLPDIEPVDDIPIDMSSHFEQGGYSPSPLKYNREEIEDEWEDENVEQEDQIQEDEVIEQEGEEEDETGDDKEEDETGDDKEKERYDYAAQYEHLKNVLQRFSVDTEILNDPNCYVVEVKELVSTKQIYKQKKSKKIQEKKKTSFKK